MLVERTVADQNFPVPQQVKRGDAGFDLRCALVDGITIDPGEQVLIPSGFAWEIPFGMYGQIAERSGLAYKKRLHVNAGVIDSNYRGEVHGLVENRSDQPIHIQYGERFCQMILLQCASAVTLTVVDHLSTNTDRGEQGFGASGAQ